MRAQACAPQGEPRSEARSLAPAEVGLGAQDPDNRCAGAWRVHRQREHVPRFCPAQGIPSRIDFIVAKDQGRAGELEAEKFVAKDLRHLTRCAAAKVTFVLLYDD